MIIDELSLSALNYEFIERLINFSVYNRTSISDFYDLHVGHLIKKNGGVPSADITGIPQQKSGTCSYSVVEAWINTHLTEEELLKKEELKVSLALTKQDRIIEVLEESEQQPRMSLLTKTPNQVSILRPITFSASKNRLLKESKMLKQFTESYQIQLREKKMTVTTETR